MKGTLEAQRLSLSLREVCNGEPGWGEGLLYRGPWRWPYLSIGAPLGNLEGGSSNGDVER